MRTGSQPWSADAKARPAMAGPSRSADQGHLVNWPFLGPEEIRHLPSLPLVTALEGAFFAVVVVGHLMNLPWASLQELAANDGVAASIPATATIANILRIISISFDAHPPVTGALPELSYR